jgi:phosphatidylinositol alpha-1,6-mannosyltransferase
VVLAGPQENCTTTEAERFNESQPFDVVPLRQVPTAPGKLAYRFGRIARIIRRFQPALIVASGERMVWLAASLRLAFRVPFVAVGHAMEVNVPARWQRELTRRSYAAANGVVCVSRYTWSRMESSGISVRAGEVIPNGADDQRFKLLAPSARDEFRRAHGLANEPVLITVGSVHERKGQEIVVRALPQILRVVPDVHYVMIGVPYRERELTELATQLGVADRVHILGIQPDDEVVRALNAADLFVMTSQHTPNGDFEGFGIAVVEAALCGRAAVVSDGSGVVEAIEPGETGLVAKLSDPASTAARISELFNDRARLASMSQRARERASGEKTWSRRGAQYDRFLRSLLVNGSGDPAD